MKMKMLAVFDNDGTICDSQGIEGECYVRAIENVTGLSLAALDWTAHEERTGSAVVRKLLQGDAAALAKEAAIEREYVRLLEEAQLKFPSEFTPLLGCKQFLERLKREAECSVAIATGCFAASARFKLRCCGIALDELPHATCSDTPRRGEIITLAARRAGFELSAVVYFGDGPWDVQASRLLGIPMIGIGRGIDRLGELGVHHLFRDYSDSDAIIRVLHTLAAQPRSLRPN